ncbi:MAG: hypothetical protein E7615_03875 [Ruminococcaceae bacterium]|nr:hypothetical protein [Oscillospiraceae bacterium]
MYIRFLCGGKNRMDGIKISFKINEMPCYAISHKNGRKTFEMQAFDGQINCDIQYDYNRRPLGLVSSVKIGDFIDVIIYPHRIELYVNGLLEDEEWPLGARFFELGDEIRSDLEIKSEKCVEPKPNDDIIISTFENAEGWRPSEKVFVGDCMPYTKDGVYHVLYLKDRHHHTSKWNLGGHQWEHISTKDFVTWNVHPTAVPIEDPEEGSFCTGSWFEDNGVQYLYYTMRLRPGVPRSVHRSISKDGYHYVKDKNFSFTLSDKYSTPTLRDPKVVKDKDGIYHIFLTTRLVKEKRGCIAHYVSKDMETWTDSGNPIYIAPDNTEPECPDYIEYNGKYYLIFSLNGKAQYLVSDRPFDGWKVPENPDVPCESVPKGAVWNGEIVFTGFKRIGGYAGDMTFKTAYSDENGQLIFK